jgi:EAL domain-containing protein (putative c-di-GMP-specific phosphodiesterase class I)
MLRKLGMKFAIEHFGLARDSKQLLDHIEVDFVKIDGSLMQGLAANETLQDVVRNLTESATRHDVRSIAERVEDANTMAVIWQLGVEFMQGYYVQEPEVVLEDTDDTGTYTGTHTGFHSAPTSTR